MYECKLYCKRGTCVVCFSFFFWLRVLDKAEYSAFESTLNSCIVSYRINSSNCKLKLPSLHINTRSLAYAEIAESCDQM